MRVTTVVSVGVVMHVSASYSCWSSHLALLTTLLTSQEWTRGGANCGISLVDILFIHTHVHTLTVNYHNIHSSARCSAYEKYDI